VARTLQPAGGKIAPQLWHIGMLRKPGAGPNADVRGPKDPPVDTGVREWLDHVLPLRERRGELACMRCKAGSAHGERLDDVYARPKRGGFDLAVAGP